MKTQKAKDSRPGRTLRRWDALVYLALAALLAGGCAADPLLPDKTRAVRAETQWGSHQGLSSVGAYRDLAVADLDNDGRLDVAGAAADPGTVAIWYGIGGGRLGPPLFLPINADVRSVALGDVDEDGLADLVCSVQKESSGIMVWRNGPQRRWTRADAPVEINNYQRVLLGDVNRDGHLDILAANMTSENQGGIQVWFGDGRGGWSGDVGPTVTGIYMDLALADVDGDANLDLAGAGWGLYGGLRIWYGDGAGGWTGAAQIARGSFYGVSLADLNNDGRLDVAGGAYRGGLRVYYSHGDGRFLPYGSPLRAFEKPALRTDGGLAGSEGEQRHWSCWTPLPTDLDGDGDLDLVVGTVDGNGITAWRNRMPEHWEPEGLLWQPIEGRFPLEGTFYEMRAADLSGDGRPEILAASFGQGIKVWPGDGTAAAVPSLPEAGTADSRNRNGEQGLGVVPPENEVYVTIDGVAEYKIGPRDLLEITLWRAAEARVEKVTVRPDGKISFGLVDDLPVAGLTASQVDGLLTERLQSFFRKPRIEVAVVEHRSRFVTLAGALTRLEQGGSGRLALDRQIRLSEMLSIAGGPSANANISDVNLRRKDGRSFRLNLFDAMTRGDTSQDPVLDDGDVIFVPTISKEANRVYVFGEVKNPGRVDFRGSDLKLFDAVTRAGGLTMFATEADTRIVRGDPARPEVLVADLDRLVTGGDQTQNFDLRNGDLVYVPREFIGDIAVFMKKIQPLVRMILLPGQVARDIDDVDEMFKNKD